MVPVEALGSYNLEVQFTRRTGNNWVSIVFPVGKVQCALCLSVWAGEASGLEMVDNRDARDNPTSKKPGELTNGHKYTALIHVRLDGTKASIEVALDDLPYLSWSGDQSALTTPWHGSQLPKHSRIALATYASSATFHSVRLRTVLDAKTESGKPSASPSSAPPPSEPGVAAASDVLGLCQRIREAWVAKDFSESRNLVWPDWFVFFHLDPASQEPVVGTPAIRL